MKRTVTIIALAAASVSALAVEATATKIAGAERKYSVSVEFSPKGKVFFPVYRFATDHIAIRAEDVCASGYEKVAERVSAVGEQRFLTWEIICITPATPGASTSAVPK